MGMDETTKYINLTFLSKQGAWQIHNGFITSCVMLHKKITGLTCKFKCHVFIAYKNTAFFQLFWLWGKQLCISQSHCMSFLTVAVTTLLTNIFPMMAVREQEKSPVTWFDMSVLPKPDQSRVRTDTAKWNSRTFKDVSSTIFGFSRTKIRDLAYQAIMLLSFQL